jgi:hypothetical protein
LKYHCNITANYLVFLNFLINEGNSTSNKKQQPNKMDAIDLLQRYWSWAFLATGITSIVRNDQTTTWLEKLRKIMMVIIVVLLSWRLEQELADRVLTPLLKRILGDPTAQQKELEEMENQLAERAREIEFRSRAAGNNSNQKR